jgi:hypothetical protein
MRFLYIMPNGHHHAYGHMCDNYHALLTNGGAEVIVSCKFPDDDSQMSWENIGGVQPLPHEFDSTPVGPELAAKLKDHGVEHHHTTRDIRKMLKQKHPLM